MDQFYFEEGYVETGYFGYIAEASASVSSSFSFVSSVDIADTTGYYIPDYIVEGYFIAGETMLAEAALSSTASLTVTVGTIKQTEVTIDGVFAATMTVVAQRTAETIMSTAFTFAATVNKTVDPGSTLANIANLNAQAQTVIDAMSTQDAAFTFAATALSVQLAALATSSEFGLTANAIKYRPRNTYARPIDFNTPPYTFSTTAYEGTHSLSLFPTDIESTETSSSLSIDSGQDFVIDFRLRFNGFYTTTDEWDFVEFGIPNVYDEGWRISILDGNTQYLYFRFWDGSGWRVASERLTTGYYYPDLTWIRITVKRTAGVIRIYSSLSGNSSSTTTTYTGAITVGDSAREYFSLKRSSNNPMLFDKFMFAKNTSNENVPGAANIVAEYLFNNDALDNWTSTFDVAASLSSTTTLTTSAIANIDAFANLDSAITTSVQAVKTTEVTADLETSATVDVDIEKTVGFSANLSGAANFNLDVRVTRTTDIDIYVTTALESQVVKTTDVESNLNNNFTMVTDNQGLIGYNALLSTAFTIDATAYRIKQFSSNLETNSTLEVNVVTVTDSSAQLDCAFTREIDYTRVRTTASDFESIASQLAAAVRIGDFFINCDLRASLTATANVIGRGEIVLQSLVSQTATATKTTDIVWNKNTVTDLSAQAFVGVSGTATLTSAYNLSANANTKVDAFVDLNCEIIQDSNINYSATATASLNGAANFALNALAYKNFVIEMPIITNISANIGFNASAASSLTAQASLTAVGRNIIIDQYVYTIPVETRTFTIASESRTHTIRNEIRTHAIEGI